MPKGVLYYIVYTVPSDSNQVKMAMFFLKHPSDISKKIPTTLSKG